MSHLGTTVMRLKDNAFLTYPTLRSSDCQQPMSASEVSHR